MARRLLPIPDEYRIDFDDESVLTPADYESMGIHGDADQTIMSLFGDLDEMP